MGVRTSKTVERCERVKKEMGDIIDKQTARLVSQLGACRLSETPRRDCDQWHGRAGDEGWARPSCVVKSAALARKGYTDVDCSEYLDTPAVLEAKVAMLADMIMRSKQLTVYAGAGLSTAAGVQDYASHAMGAWQQTS